MTTTKGFWRYSWLKTQDDKAKVIYNSINASFKKALQTHSNKAFL
ncbi:hypothetical protein [Aequorivita marina]|nr:hypothetical protein [Aequorivita sp. S2608]MDS1298225.1 hypothetical protein [Aequorivita sp. S2608]